MDITGKTAVVTGGGQGIGRALCLALHQAGAAKVVVADLNLAGAQETASLCAGDPVQCDVTDADQVTALITHTESTHGPIALFCSNAGIATGFDMEFANAGFADPAVWDKAWAVNVMAHVHAARVLVPLFKQRGEGYFLQTASAAGLLSQIGSAVYSTTKHAAVGFAENLALTHRDDGIRVSILCPQGVDTPMLHSLVDEDAPNPAAGDGVLTAEDVAQAALDGIAEDRFLILPHPTVLDYMRKKTEDYDRWIGGMAKLQRMIKSQM
jgi:NAD(P)-dependent dehydrogenase (short-subunit alcohol dehydrogenase family)